MLETDYEMDLVIIDMDFISMDQIEEVQIPIIFLTSQSECEIGQDEISTLQVTYDFLCKPFTEEELLEKLTISCKLKLIIHRRTEYYG